MSISEWWVRFRNQLASVISVPVGRPNDGLVEISRGGSELDRPWHEIRKSLSDAEEGWRTNPMVRRYVGLITSYVVGTGIEVGSDKNKAVADFIEKFWNHPQNRMSLRVPEWCDELTRSGEIFVVLFTNPLDGMSYVRLVPAEMIEDVDFDENDYETEYRYKETTTYGVPEKWWLSPKHRKAREVKPDGTLEPWMLHYAINRPPGQVRGETDLAPVLRWAKRYENWLQDRVRLNIGMRSFYFIVYAARGLKKELRKLYSAPPPSGSVIIAEKDAEQWDVITPQLNARDAKEDGRAIRWMIAAGGPGTALADFGESEESGLTKGKDTNEQRRRFLVQRQRLFAWLLADLLVNAFERYRVVRQGIGGVREYSPVSIADIDVRYPDIAPEDNETLGAAAKSVMESFTGMKAIVGDTPEFRRLALQIFIKHLGEDVKKADFDAILQGDPMVDMDQEAAIAEKHAPKPAQAGGKK